MKSLVSEPGLSKYIQMLVSIRLDLLGVQPTVAALL